MPRSTLPFLVCLGLAFALLAGGAEAGAGAMSGGALLSFARLSAVQRAQYDGGCWYDNGWNGAGYYPCGNEWNSRPDGPASSIVTPPFRRHRHGHFVAHPKAPSPLYPGPPKPQRGAGAIPSAGLHRGAPAFGGNPGLHRFGAAGVHPSPGAATVAPGSGGGGFRPFHGAAIPRIGAPAAQGLGGVGRFHGPAAFHAPGGAAIPRIGAPASPGLGGVGRFHGPAGFHAPGAAAIPRIGAPASLGAGRPAIPSGAGRH
jgi:hypothetical protein